jgi:hypothetical protein
VPAALVGKGAAAWPECNVLRQAWLRPSQDGFTTSGRSELHEDRGYRFSGCVHSRPCPGQWAQRVEDRARLPLFLLRPYFAPPPGAKVQGQCLLILWVRAQQHGRWTCMLWQAWLRPSQDDILDGGCRELLEDRGYRFSGCVHSSPCPGRWAQPDVCRARLPLFLLRPY